MALADLPLQAAAGVSLALVALCAVLPAGRNQDLLVPVVSAQLQQGMTEREALSVLRDGAPVRPLSVLDNSDGRWVQVSEAGWVSLLTPQHELWLRFVRGRLVDAGVEWVYQCDDVNVDLPPSPAPATPR